MTDNDSGSLRIRRRYETRLEDIAKTASRLTSRYAFLINLEITLAVLLAAAFYVLYTHHVIDPLAGTALYAVGSVLLIGIPAGLLLRASSKLRTQRKIAAYYETRMQRFTGTWQGTGDDGSDFSIADHPYCADLDVLGKGSLFEYLCSAQTDAGRKWLADALLHPAAPADILPRQQAIRELQNREDLREYFASATATGAYGFQGNSLQQWVIQAPVYFSLAIRIATACLCLLNLAVLVLALAGRVSPEAPLATLAAVALFTVTLHRKTAQVMNGADSVVVHELRLLTAFSRRLREEQFQCTLLREAANTFRLLSDRSLRRLLWLMQLLKWHQDPAFTYLSYLSLWGILFAMLVENRRAHYAESLAGMAAALGQLEGLSSLAAFAFEHPHHPFASLIPAGQTSTDLTLHAESLGHPLIDSAVCVRNPVTIDQHNRFILISGSNMSGKSTYLRAVGLNYVLARAGAPVCAESLMLSVFSLATSMRVADSLSDGKSRFLAEVALVKQILDRSAREPVLFLFDELFSGTNSADRRAGAAGAITHLLQNNASGFLTTHDLALSELVETLPAIARNVHFIDHLTDAAMTFDYRLRDGLAPHTNGVAILSKLGIL